MITGIRRCGKSTLLSLFEKYLIDIGIRNKLTGLRNTDFGHVLENIVFIELIRRGYDVTIGKVGTFVVDFVATNLTEKIYYQVSASIIESEVRERELRPLKSYYGQLSESCFDHGRNAF